MKDDEARIWQLVEPVLAEAGLEVVCVECLRMKTRWLVRIYMDRPGGVTIGDCEAMSGPIGDILDVHDAPPGPYTLEVSSPGLDRPLVRPQDLHRHRGEAIRVRLQEKVGGVRQVRGRLADFVSGEDGAVLVVDTDGGPLRFPWDKVSRVRLEYDFDSEKR